MEPVIRNVRNALARKAPPVPPLWWKHFMGERSLESHSKILLGLEDGPPNYLMSYREYPPGAKHDHPPHAHPWEHMEFILEGSLTLACDGKEYVISEGDAVYVPAGAYHNLHNPNPKLAKRLIINPRFCHVAVGG